MEPKPPVQQLQQQPEMGYNYGEYCTMRLVEQHRQLYEQEWNDARVKLANKVKTLEKCAEILTAVLNVSRSCWLFIL